MVMTDLFMVVCSGGAEFLVDVPSGSGVFAINCEVAAMLVGAGVSVGSGVGAPPVQASRAARANRSRIMVVMGRRGFGIGGCPSALRVRC